MIIKLAQLLYGSKAVELKYKKKYTDNGHCIKISGLCFKGLYFEVNGDTIGRLLHHMTCTIGVIVVVTIQFFMDIEVSHTCQSELDCFNETKLITNCSLFNEEDNVKCYDIKPTLSTGIALLGGFVLTVPRIAWELTCIFNFKCLYRNCVKKRITAVFCFIHLPITFGLSFALTVCYVYIAVNSNSNSWLNQETAGRITGILLALLVSVSVPIASMLSSERKKGGYLLNSLETQTNISSRYIDIQLETEGIVTSEALNKFLESQNNNFTSKRRTKEIESSDM